MLKVSVIIPSYNSVQYISDALESALKQTYQDYEIIVIDDGSTDNIRDVITHYQGKHPQKIRYIYQDNQGLAVARNTGIKEAKGEFIALLDADDAWYPNRLAEGVRVLESNPDVGLVHANIDKIDKNGNYLDTPKRNIQHLTGNIFRNILLRDAHIACPTVLFRKACCDTVGLFDEKLTRLGCEDRELWLRIVQKYKTHYIDAVLAKYRVHDKSMSHNEEKMMKARHYVLDKFLTSNKLLKRRVLASIYKENGDSYLYKGMFRESQQQYFNAIKLWPLSFWAWINFVKASLKIRPPTTNNKKRIAVVTGLFPALSEKFIVDEVTTLIDLGYEVDIVALKKGDMTKLHPEITQYSLLNKDRCYFYEFPENKSLQVLRALGILCRYGWRYPKEISQCLNTKKYGGKYFAMQNLFLVGHFLEHKYDLIHCHFGNIAMKFAFLKDILNIKMIVSFHGYDISSQVVSNGNGLYQSLFKKSDLLCPVSDYFGNRLRGLGAQTDKIRVHYCGIRFKDFEYVPRSFNFNKQIRLISVGRLTPKKGFAYSIEAIAKLVPKHSNICYTIIGEGELRSELQDLSNKLGIGHIVEFAGGLTHDEVKNYLCKADIFVLPSVTALNGDQEGIPNVIKEAMATGMPVVCTNHAGIPELVENGENGFLVPEKNALALAEKIEYFITHPEECRAMGKKGRGIVKKRFDMLDLCRQLEKISREIE